MTADVTKNKGIAYPGGQVGCHHAGDAGNVGNERGRYLPLHSDAAGQIGLQNAQSLGQVGLQPQTSLHEPFTIADVPIAPSVREQFAELLEKLANKPLPRPTGYHVLCLQFVRTHIKHGSLTLVASSKTQVEDEYQGRCGLVLALGPDAYKGEKFGSGPWCKPGDVVSWRNLDAAAARVRYAEVTLARLADDTIVDVGIDPSLVS